MTKLETVLMEALELAHAMLRKIASGGSYPAADYYDRLHKIERALGAGKIEKAGDAFHDSI